MTELTNPEFTASKQVAPGLAGEELIPGLLVTLSRNLATGDRGVSRYIWKVVAANAGHLVIAPAQKAVPSTSMASGPRLVSVDKYEFYSADHLLQSLEPAEGG